MHTVEPDKSYLLNCRTNFRRLLESLKKTEHILFYFMYFLEKICVQLDTTVPIRKQSKVFKLVTCILPSSFHVLLMFKQLKLQIIVK